MCDDLRVGVVSQIDDVGGDSDADADGDRQKNQTDFAGVQAVALGDGLRFGGEADGVDDGEDFEKGVEYRVHQACVEACEEDGGVEGVDLDGAPEVADDDFVDGEGGLVDFGLGFEVGVSGEFAQALRAAEEDVGCGGFGEEEEEADEDGGCEPDDFPE